MSEKTSNTAILIFANSSSEEARQKPFFKGKSLFKALNAETLKTVQKTGIPYFLVTEKEQIGSSFGCRFVNAIHSVYKKGFENIITVGNDTPHLTSSQLRDTAKLLKTNKFVLGPSKDGGFYLMGLHKSQFDSASFLKLPWQTSRLSKSIDLLIRKANIDVVRLEVLTDVDESTDLKTLLNSYKILSTDLKRIILALHHFSTNIFERLSLEKFQLKHRILYNKGSPNFLHL